MSDGWIGVDLDGTLVEYVKWTHHTHIGAPVPAMVARVKRWLAEGKEVRIFTARVAEPDPIKKQDILWALARFTNEIFGQVLAVTNIKDYEMLELWDDRCVQVIPNTGEPVGRSTRQLDNPWRPWQTVLMGDDRVFQIEQLLEKHGSQNVRLLPDGTVAIRDTEYVDQRTARMEETLSRAEQQFLDYADQHDAKGTPEAMAKAETNRHMAVMCREAQQ